MKIQSNTPVNSIRAVRAFLLGLFLFFILSSQGSAGITVGIIGDQFGVKGAVGTPAFNKNKEAAYRAMRAGVAALNRAGKMDTVLHVGDLLESTQDNATITSDFSHAVTILDRLSSGSRPGWFLTPGDHDVNPLEWVQNSSDRSKEQLFKSLYSTVSPRVKEDLYYSFDIKGYHFVALYSHEQLRSDPRWGNIFLAKISDRQLAWLEKDLAAAAGSRGVIVFTHQPLWYNQSAWRRVHAVLARHNTRVVVAGHCHYDQNDHDSDGIQYRVVGAVGGHVKTANARAGGWWHVTRLTIADNGDVSWQLIPMGDDAKETFTSRWDMDQVQAVDYNLGNTARRIAGQIVYVKAGRLVAGTGTAPAVIELSGLGNPIGQPIDISVSIKEDSGYRIRSGRFAPGMCTIAPETGETTPDINTGTGRIKPGANIGASNYSTVRAACAEYSPDFSRCLSYTPLWTGSVEYTGSDQPVAQDSIPLVIIISFDSKDGMEKMKIRREVSIPVREYEN